MVLSACLVLNAAPQSSSPAEQAARAHALVAAGRATEAIPIYQELLQGAPGNAVLHLNLAIAQFEVGRFRDAIGQCQTAVGLQPDLTNAWLFLGASHLKAGEPGQAIDPLEKVIAARPDERNAILMLAEALLAVRRFDDAVGRFLDASKLLPAEPRVWYGLERGCEGVVGGALEGMQRGESGPYRDSLAGDASADAGHYGLAIERYKQALRGHPNAPEVWRAMARVYRDSGHPDWALQAEAKRAAAPAPDCGAHPASCAFEAADYEAAFRAAAGSGLEAKYWRAKACRELGGRALERLTSLGDSRQLHEIEARRLDRRGLFAESARHWRQAAELAPGDNELQKGLALALYRSADFGEAVKILRELIAQESDSSELNYLCGDSLLLSERPAEALPYLERALGLNPGSGLAEAALGHALLQLHRFGDAIPHLEAAAISGANSQLLFQLARAYKGAGDDRKAAAAMARYKVARASELDRQRAAEASSEIAPP